MQGSVHRYDAGDASGSLLLDDGRVLDFPRAALDGSGLRGLRVGQRVSFTCDPADDSTVTRVWIVGIGEGEQIR